MTKTALYKIALLILLAVVVVGGAGVFALKKNSAQSEPVTRSNAQNGNNGGDSGNISQTPCYVEGCSSEICSDKPDAVSACLWTEAFACYKTARCERQQNGQCGWTQTLELKTCLDSVK